MKHITILMVIGLVFSISSVCLAQTAGERVMADIYYRPLQQMKVTIFVTCEPGTVTVVEIPQPDGR